jgi:hypothetical protein
MVMSGVYEVLQRLIFGVVIDQKSGVFAPSAECQGDLVESAADVVRSLKRSHKKDTARQFQRYTKHICSGKIYLKK